jgi:adenylate cyclase
MSNSRIKRRLAAVLAADVVGYSHLMGKDEVGTLVRLKSLHKNLVHPTISDSNGRIVKLMRDGLLAEFPSVVDAVQCAANIQQSMVKRETELDNNQRIRLRIGVNLGDIIVEGSDIYGDGVNIAARLEGLAEPGGICVSAKVYEEVRNKLSISFKDMGAQEVKNIQEPIRAYSWIINGSSTSSVGPKTGLPLSDKPSIAVLPFNNMVLRKLL